MYDKAEFRKKNKDFFENSYDFIIIYSLDGRVLDVNKVFLDGLGYSQEEVINKRFRKFLDKEGLEQAYKSIKNLKEFGYFSKANIYRIRKKDGDYIYIQIVGIPLRKNGEIYAVFAIGHDVTELKEIEEKLKESEELFRKIAQNTFIGFSIIQDDKIIYSNEALSNIYGFTLDEMKNWTQDEYIGIILPEYQDIVINTLKKYQKMNYESAINIEFPFYSKNRVIKWVLTNTKSINHRDSPAILTSVIDITEKKEAEFKLIESEEKYKRAYEKENFYKDLFTHDTKNILHGILLNVDMADIQLANNFDPERMKENLINLREQVNRGINLVKNVKKFSQIDDSNLELKPMNLKIELDKAINIVKNFTENKQINISLQKITNGMTINADDFLIDVFENILINAVKHNDNSLVNITIKAKPSMEGKKKKLLLEFIDNGKGVPNLLKESIFNREQKNRTVSGMGLGLSIIKKILKKYNAKIWIEDKIPNDYTKGSNFKISFPY